MIVLHSDRRAVQYLCLLALIVIFSATLAGARELTVDEQRLASFAELLAKGETRGGEVEAVPETILEQAGRTANLLEENAGSIRILTGKAWEELASRELAAAPGDAATRQAGTAQMIYRQRSPSTVLVAGQQSVGSGVVVINPSLVLTNWHVIDGNDSVMVIFRPDDPGQFERSEIDARRATVIAYDAIPDLALVQIGLPDQSRRPVPIGDVEKLEIGSSVYAIGHPQGQVWTFTQGLVSQVRRNYNWEYEDGSQHRATVVQTQTPINPGSSGGPLFDSRGSLVGLNTFMKAQAGFLNFAVAVDEISRFLAARPTRGKQVAAPSVEVLATYDTDGDGRADTFAIDQDKDGKVDFWLADTDGDGTPETVMWDSNGNGRPETFAQDSNGDGTPDLYSFDLDEDGQIERRGEDLDGDGKLDRVWDV